MRDRRRYSSRKRVCVRARARVRVGLLATKIDHLERHMETLVVHISVTIKAATRRNSSVRSFRTELRSDARTATRRRQLPLLLHVINALT
jgi:hypothetical protein